MIYIVDTNAYVRIAKRVGILGDHGDLALRMISTLTAECHHSDKLRSKFQWMHEPPHPKIRAESTLNFKDTAQANINKKSVSLRAALRDLLKDFEEKRRERGQGGAVLSPVDESVACVAYAMGYGVITDEAPLTRVCEEFDIPCLGTLDILHKLHTGSFVTRQIIEELVCDWQRDRDTPKGWHAKYRDLFGYNPPTP